MDLAPDDLLKVVEHVRQENHLIPLDLRREVEGLEPMIFQAPALAFERLKDLLRPFEESLERFKPQGDLYRCVSLQTFHHRCTRSPFSDMSLPTFRMIIETAQIPEHILRDALLISDSLFPPEHSWLVQGEDVKRLSADEVPRALKIPSYPPFVLFEFPQELLDRAKVTVRRPNGGDSVFGPHPQWSRWGIPAGVELIDWHIPTSAVGAVLWRP